MKDKYMLEIDYPTTGAGRFMVRFESDLPFQAINQGDVIDAAHLDDADQSADLLVASVKHSIWIAESGELKHKVYVYADLFDETDEIGE